MSRRAQRNVGVIGLGIIGSRVAENLRQKGFRVFVWNRSPRPVPNFVGTPSEVAEMCDYIQIFVSDDDALLESIRQLAPALAPRHIIMAHPTVAPHSVRAAADMVERRGARFLEAPFTGSKIGAEKGELVYYVAGDEAALKEARAVLEASSKEIVEIGEIGQATAVKVATNIVTAASVQAAAEALALIQNAGISPEKFVAAMQSNASNSGTLSMKLPKMVEGNFDPHFSTKHMLKDMQIAIRLGLVNHLELSVTAAARDRLLEQVQRGFGDEDFSAVVRKYFHEIGVTQKESDLDLFEQPMAIAQSKSPPEIREPVTPVEDSEVVATGEETTQEMPRPLEQEAASNVETLASAGDVTIAPETEKPDLDTGTEPSPTAPAPAAPDIDTLPSAGDVTMAPETEKPDLDTGTEPSPTAPAPAAPDINTLPNADGVTMAPEIEKPDLHTGTEPSPAAPAPAAPDEAADEMSPRRGLFDRLLRRGSEF
jgi:3-hydroxyisobutyrate dehydrogenase-like beta-hydroxyacid dehydrogenase